MLQFVFSILCFIGRPFLMRKRISPFISFTKAAGWSPTSSMSVSQESWIMNTPPSCQCFASLQHANYIREFLVSFMELEVPLLALSRSDDCSGEKSPIHLPFLAGIPVVNPFDVTQILAGSAICKQIWNFATSNIPPFSMMPWLLIYHAHFFRRLFHSKRLCAPIAPTHHTPFNIHYFFLFVLT